MKTSAPPQITQRPPSGTRVIDLPPGGFRIPRPSLRTLQSVQNATQTVTNLLRPTSAGGDDEGWGSDFDDVSWTQEEQDYFDARFRWEDRQMAGVSGEKPPVPPRGLGK